MIRSALRSALRGSVSSALGQSGAPGLLQYVSAANRTDYATSGPTVTSGQQYHANKIAFWNGRKAVKNLQVWYANFSLGSDGAEAANASAIPDVRCTLEREDGTKIPLLTNGQISGVLAAGAWLKFTSDIELEAGEKYFIRTYRECTVGGTEPRPYNYNGTSRGEGGNYGTDQATILANFAGTITTSDALAGIGPSAIIGETADGEPEPCFGIIGDSIADGNAEARKDGDAKGARGYLSRGLSTAERHFVRFTRSGGTFAGFAIANFTRRLEVAQLCCTHIINQLGQNNLGASAPNGWEALADAYIAEGFQIIGAQVLCNSSTVNSYVDAGGQTTRQASERAALTARVTSLLGTKLVGVIDARPHLADPGDDDIWISTGAANYATTDGTHPSAAAHELGKQAVLDAETAGYLD